MAIFIATNVYAQNDKVYLNTNYSFSERAADLVSRMALEEEVKQLCAIPRLGVHQYFYWSEGQHGINALFGNNHNGKENKHMLMASACYKFSC